MTVLLNNTLKKKNRLDMNIGGHDIPLIPIYISLAERIRSRYNKYYEVTKNITD
jgi:hypothetical protein